MVVTLELRLTNDVDQPVGSGPMPLSADEKRYREEQFAKLLTVVNAADQNDACGRDVVIETSGIDPSARCRIPAHILRDLIKAP